MKINDKKIFVLDSFFLQHISVHDPLEHPVYYCFLSYNTLLKHDSVYCNCYKFANFSMTYNNKFTFCGTWNNTVYYRIPEKKTAHHYCRFLRDIQCLKKKFDGSCDFKGISQINFSTLSTSLLICYIRRFFCISLSYFDFNIFNLHTSIKIYIWAPAQLGKNKKPNLTLHWYVLYHNILK